MIRTDKFIDTFREEASELLQRLEAALLQLERDPEDKETISEAFRALHTLKGSGAMFGFDDIASLAHELETTFELVRDGTMRITPGLIDLTLKARDELRAMVEGNSRPDEAHFLKAAIRQLVDTARRDPQASTKKPAEPASSKPNAERNAGPQAYRIRFKPPLDLFMNGTNPVALLSELRSLGQCSVKAQFDRIPLLEDYRPDACYTWWDIVLITSSSINSIRDVFIFVEDFCDLTIDLIDDGSSMDDSEQYKRLGEILLDRGDVKPEDLQAVLDARPPIGQVLAEKGFVTPERVESALAEQELVRGLRSTRSRSEDSSSVRVSAAKLDSLVNLVGELVIAQARLSETAAGHSDARLTSVAEEVERLAQELRDSAMSLRMLPIGTTFAKFRRLVRDLGRELGREVEIATDGAETELDKGVIERLNDPIVHLIRNAIDHGIEPPDIRERMGKRRTGLIQLKAWHSGTNVLIEVKDDGAGLDAQAIRDKATASGLIAPDSMLSEKELYSLIFAAGFSTSKTISNVSGRGVGMDVVRRSIEGLGGKVEISSRKGIGTSVTMVLPLTLAIIDGLQVEVGDGCFVFPLSCVKECVELQKPQAGRGSGQDVLYVRGQVVPFIRLRDWFAVQSPPSHNELVVIAEADGNKVGFVVDKVIGEHQTVIRTLGRVYKNIVGISGATIRGDGSVALILDIPKLVQSVVSSAKQLTYEIGDR